MQSSAPRNCALSPLRVDRWCWQTALVLHDESSFGENSPGSFGDSVGVPVVIVGAGLSGLVAAQTLTDAGRSVVLLDKGRSPGGRLATRRLGGPTHRADSGAQFFTVRSVDFADLVHTWRRAGIIEEWCRGFGTQGDGHPRYCALGGMNTIAKFLASTQHVETEVTVTEVREFDARWQITAGDGRTWLTDTVILSAPVPQSLALVDEGGIMLPASVRAELDAVAYGRVFALLVRMNGPTAVPEPGGAQLSIEHDPTFSFVADNHRKGISDDPILTLHTHEHISLQRWEEDPSETAEFLLSEARRWIGDGDVTESYVHRWKFSRPTNGHPNTHVLVDFDDGRRLGFIGDAFGGAKVEGAAISGLSIAHALTERMLTR